MKVKELFSAVTPDFRFFFFNFPGLARLSLW